MEYEKFPPKIKIFFDSFLNNSAFHLMLYFYCVKYVTTALIIPIHFFASNSLERLLKIFCYKIKINLQKNVSVVGRALIEPYHESS